MEEHCGKIDSFKFGFLLLKLICELKIDEKTGTII
jgi:hypothetical protein